MTENKLNFLKLASNDEEVKAKLKDLVDKIDDKNELVSAIINLAAQYGFVLNKEDFTIEKTTGKLSLEELKQVTGGGGCFCPVCGGGLSDGLECYCTMGGEGELYNLARELDYLYTEYDENGIGSIYVCSGAAEGACACLVAGVGATNGVTELTGTMHELAEQVRSGKYTFKG